LPVVAVVGQGGRLSEPGRVAGEAQQSGSA
jgi:hypothetical protein